MSPKGKQHKALTDKEAKARSSAVRKIEQKEAEQDARRGKTGKPVGGAGRVLHDGDTGSA